MCRLYSARHVLELSEVEHRFNALRVIQAADGDEDHPRRTLQLAAEHPGAAVGEEISIQPLTRLGDVVKRLGSPLISVKPSSGTPKDVAA